VAGALPGERVLARVTQPQWRSKHVDVTVIFQKPTRYCPKASYRVIGSEIGVWVGYLHGASHKNIGKPVQVYTPEQLARELEYRRSLREER